MELKKIKILAIDDNRDNLISLKALIYEAFPQAITFTALSGAKGLEIAQEQDPDVILLDVVMPDMDGFEVCKKLKSDKFLSEIPIVFVTAIKGERESRIRALECGAEAFLSKPIDEIELTAEIRAMIKIKAASLAKRDEKEILTRLVAERTLALEQELKRRKLIELELREKEVQYRNLADSGTALIWAAGVDKLCNYFNEPWLDFRGRALELELGNGWMEGVHPDHLPQRLEIYTTSFDNRAKFDIEYRLLHRSGEYVWIRDLGSPNYNSNGSFIGYIGYCFDISKDKTAEILLRESEEKFKLLYTSMSQGLALHEIILDDEGKPIDYVYLDINDSYTKLLGVTREMSIGKRIKEVMPQVEQYWIDIFGKVALTGEPEYYENYLDTTGRYYATYSYSPKINQFAVLVSDITERIEAGKKILKVSQHYQALIEKAPDGIVLISVDGEMIYASPSARKLFGFEPDEALADPNEFTHPDDLPMVLYHLQKLIEQPNYIPTLQYRYADKHGEWKWVESTFSNLIAHPSVEAIVINFRDITDRKIAEEALRANEEKYKMFIDLAPDAFFQGISRGNFIEVNSAASEITGYNRDELLRMEMKDLFSNYSIEQSPLRYDLIENGEIVRIERDVLRKNGESIVIEMTSKKMPDGTYQSFVRNITDRKKIENKLVESEERYRALVENSLEGVMLVDLKGIILFANYSTSRILDMPDTNSIIGRSVFEFLSSESVLEASVDLVNEKNEDKSYTASYHCNTYSGREIWVESIGKRIKHEGNEVDLISLRDITERKKAQEEIISAKELAEESEKRLLSFINSIPDIVCYKDGSGRWLLANEADLELFHLKNVDYRGKTDDELSYFTADIYKTTFNNCVESDFQSWENGIITRGIEIIPTINGVKKVYDVFKVPIFKSNGERDGLAVIGRDITELQNTQEELILSKEKAEESDRLKSAFLANMSHEIRTPMNGILGFANLLKEPNLTGEEQHEYIRIIEKSGARMLNIIHDIIDISKIESGQMETIISETILKDQIEELYSFFNFEAEQKQISLRYNVSPADLEIIIDTDKDKIYAVLTNLVKNALKFTDKGFIEFGYAHIDSQILFYVKDTGAGIRKEHRNIIFDRFRQGSELLSRNYEGAGLGLAISKAYVEMLGGRIWVESEECIGSTFYFTIPFIKQEVNKIMISETKDENKMMKLKILIAEDDETSLNLIAFVVKKISREIIKAKSGTEAVEICRSNPDIDLILMDIKMPILNGYEATKQIREFNKDVVIIAQTAYAFRGDKEKALETGCDDYITKPINHILLNELIRKYF